MFLYVFVCVTRSVCVCIYIYIDTLIHVYTHSIYVSKTQQPAPAALSRLAGRFCSLVGATKEQQN